MTDAIDISSEEWRVYVYDGGLHNCQRSFRIDRPAKLYILDEGRSHRVVDRDGVTHRPERGWVGICWKPAADQPEFVA